jgi:uncharacterized membrane protein
MMACNVIMLLFLICYVLVLEMVPRLDGRPQWSCIIFVVALAVLSSGGGDGTADAASNMTAEYVCSITSLNTRAKSDMLTAQQVSYHSVCMFECLMTVLPFHC